MRLEAINNNTWLSENDGDIDLLGGGTIPTVNDDYFTTLNWGWSSRECTGFVLSGRCIRGDWVGTGNRSGLDILDSTGTGNPGQSAGSLQTNGASVNTYTIQHRNEPVSFGDYLDSASLLSVLFLTPSDGSEWQIPALDFGIDFLETRNDYKGPGSTAICGDNNPNTPCRDLFGLSNTQGLELSEGAIVQSFVLGDFEYSLNIGLPTLAALNNAQCVVLGMSSGCFGFVTPEDQTTTRQLSLAITAEQVPVPGTLALMGLGLALVGWASTMGHRRVR